MSVRVYQLAKQLGLASKHVVRLLRERGLNVNGPSNSIPSVYADALVEEIGGKNLTFEEKDTVVGPEVGKEQTTVSNENIEKAQETHTASVPSDPVSTSIIPDGSAENGCDEKVSTQKIADPAPRTDVERRSTRPRRQWREKFEKQKKPLMVSLSSIDKPKKRDDDPEVRLPDQQKDQQKTPMTLAENEERCEVSTPKFKPFLKKIERPQLKRSDLQTIEIKPPVVVRALATQMNVKPFQLISKLMSMNIFASMNQEIDITIAQSVAEKFGYILEVAKPEQGKEVKARQFTKKPVVVEKKGQNLIERPPVVCVLGHVDHGKTTLLDTIRNARVAAGEAGGITQHVAAYQIEHGGKKITFIDTPGHAAFSKMRERGANMTDIGILVVAADDGFMPQTDEALKFAKNANIPVVVAINKIDSKGSNVDRVKQQMQQRGITPEEWGGEVLCAPISALKGTNIDHLLELIRLQAEIMELRADASGHGEGVILESKMAVGHGAVASAIVQDGTLKVGDCIICGPCYCKVKSLVNDRGEQIKEAFASTPVNIIGWSDIPEVGAKFTFIGTEKLARKKSEENSVDLKESAKPRSGHEQKISNIDQLFSAIAAVEEKFLNVILRADVHGSAEALRDFLGTIKSKKIKLNILDFGVGNISKNDITLANASKAQIVAFNVKIEANAQVLAKQLGVKVIQHNIIYELVDQVREAMADCLDPELHENKLGAVEVRQIFNIKNSVIAGCMVTEGKMMRDKFARVIRKKEVIFQGKFASIKRQKEDSNEVRAGFECGIVVSGFDAFETGDIVECFEVQKIQPSL
ncbi:MAG: translation initiation factor IF-2 [Puniceicoccales bacterium]|jgi:translation initiation factor IF-2|nr:translation initiation factor IF-2 [Puniceicoccales bacterium]